MLTKEDWILIKLAEECDEVGQRVMKLLQFGPKEVQRGHVENNEQRLRDEVNDLLVVLTIVEELGVLVPNTNAEYVAHEDAKRKKLDKYLKLAQSLGRIEL